MPAFEAPGLVDESHETVPAGVRRRSGVQSFLALQRTIGNRAATHLLSRQPTQEPAAGFHGDGKHRKNDVAYALAIGKADAARLGTAYVLTPADKADIDEKTAWFTGAARDTYSNTVTAALSARALKQAGNLETHLKAKYDDLREWNKDRINAWEANAKIPVEDSIGLDLLFAVISIVSEGIGGIVLGLIEHGFERALEKKGADAMKNLLMSKVAEEFVGLSALEAADLISDKALHAAVDRAGTRIGEAQQKAMGEALKTKTKAALVRKDGKIAAYAEALRDRAQMVKENCEQSVTETYLGMTELDLKMEAACISALVEGLKTQPEPFMREMTSGYLQLHQDPDPAAWERYFDCGDNQHIAGVDVRIPGHYDIGNWVNPKVNPPGLELVTHHDVVNPETLAYYRGARLEEVNTTMVFWFQARHFREGVFHETFLLSFLRTADGKFPPTHPGCFDDALEWLASYYDQQLDDHSDDERQRLAPLGAKKLYEALKDQKVTDTTAY